MRLLINDARIEIVGQHQKISSAITRRLYRLILDGPEPKEKLKELHELCLKWGTVTNTNSISIIHEGEFLIKKVIR